MNERLDFIPFDSQDPFPLMKAGSYNYGMAKQHAILTDQWLGLETDKVEKNLASQSTADLTPQERWIGLDAQSFNTPYVEIRTILDLLNPQPGDKIIDLGCGYGRMSHVVGRHYPLVFFVGYELVSARIIEAQKSLKNFSYPLVRIEQADLVQQKPESAAFYFIYDFGSKSAIEKTLNDLKEISVSRKIKVVARGKAARFYIHRDHPWLCEVHDPQHFETFSIYQS